MNYNNFMQVDYNDNIWIPSTIANGREDIMQNSATTSKITKAPIITDDNNINSISYKLTNTSLSVNFFSKENINKIQTLIKRGVFFKSNRIN